MNLRFRCKSSRAADITAMTDFDPELTSADSKSRNAVDVLHHRGCAILSVGSTETLGSETARFHRRARRRGGGVAARGARAAAGDAGGGFLSRSSPRSYAPMVAAFRQGLKEVGYVEGQNVAIECWSAASVRFE